MNDVVAGVDVDRYEARLDELVGRLARAGAGRVLVGNCPDLDRLPADLAWRASGLVPEPAEANRIVGGDNTVIDRVVAAFTAALRTGDEHPAAAENIGLEPFPPSG